MSVVLRTIQAFPRGRTIEELHALLGTTFHHEERMALLTELDALATEGSIRRSHSGRWVALAPALASPPTPRPSGSPQSSTDERITIVAAAFARTEEFTAPLADVGTKEAGEIDPQALLRYWRAALRADPRGAITEALDRHGAVWHLISGRGILVPDEGREIQLRIALEALAPDSHAVSMPSSRKR